MDRQTIVTAKDSHDKVFATEHTTRTTDRSAYKRPPLCDDTLFSSLRSAWVVDDAKCIVVIIVIFIRQETI